MHFRRKGSYVLIGCNMKNTTQITKNKTKKKKHPSVTSVPIPKFGFRNKGDDSLTEFTLVREPFPNQ